MEVATRELADAVTCLSNATDRSRHNKHRIRKLQKEKYHLYHINNKQTHETNSQIKHIRRNNAHQTILRVREGMYLLDTCMYNCQIGMANYHLLQILLKFYNHSLWWLPYEWKNSINHEYYTFKQLGS
jgi:CO dehydrogenase nickel-insertion accessory protein CooC1